MRKRKLYTFLFIVTSLLISVSANAQLDAPNLVNNFSLNNCSPYLTFPAVENCNIYEIQMSIDETFTNITSLEYYDNNNVTLPLLKFDTEYFLRARSINETDTSEWSNIISNTTYSYGWVDVDITEAGDYLAYEDAITCALESWWEIDTIQSFDSQFFLRDTTYNNDSLEINAPYYFCSNYYIRSKCVIEIDTTPNWSYHEWNYIEIPCSPTLVYPNEFDLTNNITNLKLERYDQPLRYVFQIDTSNTFSNPREFEIADTDTFDNVIASDFYFDTQHYWRVRAINSIDTSYWSSVFTFTMCNILSHYPLDGSNTNTNLTLSASDIGNLTGYIFEYDTVPEFNSGAFTEIVSPTSSVQLSSLNYAQAYYWRARAYHSLDTSEYTETRTFNTISNPELITPLNGSTGLNLKEILQIELQNGVSLYEYNISENPEFTEGETLEMSHTEFEENIQTSLLKFGTEYYWKARYINENDTSNWSEIFNFSTIDVPVLSLPANGTSEVDFTQLMLQWQNIQYVDSYTLWVSTSSDFIEYDEYLQSSYGSIVYLEDLLPSTTYYWKVKATSAIDESDWSDTWTFTTKNVSSIKSNNQIKMQIFPNPSSNGFIVKTSLPEYKDAEIKIAGLNGHLKDIIPVTEETTIIPTKGWKSGTYICNLFVDGKLVKAEKLIFK